MQHANTESTLTDGSITLSNWTSRYLVWFFVVLAEALGLPVPAALALVAGGAAAAAGVLHLTTLFLLAVGAMLLGDSLLFVLGRYMDGAARLSLQTVG